MVRRIRNEGGKQGIMGIREILKRCDHTQLSVTATWADIKAIVDDGIKYGTASVCIPPCYVETAKAYAAGRVPICTVIGFPNGYNTACIKFAETAESVRLGADEIDMVINLGAMKAGRYAEVRKEIETVKSACDGKILKVIVETCLLTDEEKAVATHLVAEAGADFIKTSTGFSKAGATFRDVEIFKEEIEKYNLGIKIKAAGGIGSIADAEKFIALGAGRLGTSRIVKIVKEEGLL